MPFWACVGPVDELTHVSNGDCVLREDLEERDQKKIVFFVWFLYIYI